MITGLQPETFASFIGQRSRWCRGMIQILLLKNPLFKQGLTLPQRISYMSNCFYWLFPFVRLTFLLSPLLFILFNLKIFNASAEDFVAYTVTYLVASEILRNYLHGKVRWPWISELYEYVQSVFLVRAIVSVILNPRKPTFNVTDKGVNLTQRQLSNLAWPFFAIFASLGVVLYIAFQRYQSEPALGDLILITGAWNLLNLVIAGAALGIVTEQPTDSTDQGISLPTAKRAELQIAGQLLPVTVRQISSARAIIELQHGRNAPIRQGDVGRLAVVDHEPELLVSSVPMRVGRTIDIDQNRIEIDLNAEPQHYGAITNLMFSDLDVPRKIRSERQNRRMYLTSLFTLLKWSIVCPIAAINTALSTRGASSEQVSRRRQRSVESKTVNTQTA